MAMEQTDCEAALKTILSLLNQNNANKGFQTSQGVASPPFVNPVSPPALPVSLPTLDDRTLQALIAAYTGITSTAGKAFAGTPPQAPVDERTSRVVAAIVPGVLKAMAQEKAYQPGAGTAPLKDFDWEGAARTAIQIGGFIASLF